MKKDDIMEKGISNAKKSMPVDIVKDWISVIERQLTDDRKIKDNTNKDVMYKINGFRENLKLPVYRINHKYFLYRITNGRLRSDIIAYETLSGKKLKYNQKEDQYLIEKYLIDKFKEKHKELKNLLKQNGQEDPLISRCDGVLINGNRRLVAMRQLSTAPQHRDLSNVKVVVLPKDTSEKEIRQIERKLQIQPKGDAPYTDFDKAVLMLECENLYNWSIEDQLKDDDTFAGLEEDEFKKKMNDYINNFIVPLKFTNEYLSRLHASDAYSLVRGKMGRRWQAMREFSKYFENLRTNFWKTRTKAGIKKKELSKIKSAAHYIIRKQDFGYAFRDLNSAMRVFKKCLSKKETREILFDLNDIEMPIYPEECSTLEDLNRFDEKWKSNTNQGIKVENILKKANGIYISKTEHRSMIDEIREFRDYLYSEQFNEKELENILKSFRMEEIKEVHDLFSDINQVVPEMKNMFWTKFKGKEKEYIEACKRLKKKFNINK
ncbi:MAG: ParB N-terminal domain-containing protein [Candidatus Marinimicrobia bacterium]|nr:ParB N-terminal domain-containing protein [Candidatus Neomarinimicrobiota bacterium]